MKLFYATGWKKINEDWEKEPWFAKQLDIIHTVTMELLLPSFLTVQEEEKEFYIKWEGEMANKLKIRFSKIHKKGAFKGNWTSKFGWKKRSFALKVPAAT